MQASHQKYWLKFIADHCTLCASLRRSFLYLQERYNATSGDDRAYWLAQIRDAYSLYRRSSIGSVSRVDRYAAIVGKIYWS